MVPLNLTSENSLWSRITTLASVSSRSAKKSRKCTAGKDFQKNSRHLKSDNCHPRWGPEVGLISYQKLLDANRITGVFPHRITRSSGLFSQIRTVLSDNSLQKLRADLKITYLVLKNLEKISIIPRNISQPLRNQILEVLKDLWWSRDDWMPGMGLTA